MPTPDKPSKKSAKKPSGTGRTRRDAPDNPVGLTWADYVAGLVASHGSLTAVAEKLSAQRGYVDDVGSVERGLRRLRGRGQRDGGVWGRRVLRCFGLPRDIAARVRWMGQYHTRFTDLPRSLCRELLQVWDKPPVSDSPARIWIQLGLASVALRGCEPEQAREHVRQAQLAAASAEPAARIELALVGAYMASRRERDQVQKHLHTAETLLAEFADDPALGADDRACLWARYIDHRGYELNRPPPGQAPDHQSALALYTGLPDRDAPPFALCRRENGVGWSKLNLGDRAGAIEHARISVQHAGDGGSLRLRAMALNLLARVLPGTNGEAARARALAIARRLEDEELRVRISFTSR